VATNNGSFRRDLPPWVAISSEEEKSGPEICKEQPEPSQALNLIGNPQLFGGGLLGKPKPVEETFREKGGHIICTSFASYSLLRKRLNAD